MRRMMTLTFALALVASSSMAAKLEAPAKAEAQSKTAQSAAAYRMGGSCARPIYVVPELAECAIEGRWVSTGTFHHGDVIFWGAQTSGGYEFNFYAGVVQLVDSGRYVISVETPVASDCGMHNWVTLKINGVSVHVAESFGGTRISRNLFTYTKTDGETDTVSVVFTSGPGEVGDAGAFAQGAVLRIQKDPL